MDSDLGRSWRRERWRVQDGGCRPTRLSFTASDNRHLRTLIILSHSRKLLAFVINMLFQKLAIASALAASVSAQDINQDDVPQQCTSICADVVSLSRRCDDTTSTPRPPLHSFTSPNSCIDDDAAELNCICQAPNAGTLIPSCEACVAEFDNDDNDTDDDSVDENGKSHLVSNRSHLI